MANSNPTSNNIFHIAGRSLIGNQSGNASNRTFQGIDPSNAETLAPQFHEASDVEVRHAGHLAAQAAFSYGRLPGTERAQFLRAIADEIERIGDPLLERFIAESGLPRGRAQGERGRTCGQLRLFAALVEKEDWNDPRIDEAQPTRKPAPKPDTRQMLCPIGPVAVFGPANFPLAFSVAGGDTASALAAGCPVIVKAHSSHPGTSELVGHAIQRAAQRSNLEEGVFSLLFGSGRTVGTALIKDPAIRGVGFTGSKVVGKTLFDLCNARPVPIPFFGELSSLNPVCLLPEALKGNPESIAEGLYASVTLGCGQFCTNPGAVLYIAGTPEADAFVTKNTELFKNGTPASMLSLSTRDHYLEGLARIRKTPAVETLVEATKETGKRNADAAPALFRCDSNTFEKHTCLHEEVFGPCTLLIACQNREAMYRAVSVLEGQLTATIHATETDLATANDLLPLLEARAGRLIFNGWPTGVEVCDSMVHGGPWPATTDSRFTSVGTGAIRRWLRPICWQNAPSSVLPRTLRP